MDNNNNSRRSSASALAGAGDEGDYDDAEEDRDMTLSKEDFEMLHALHRSVPLPALSSNILRIVCDEDLQVAHEDDDGADDNDDDDCEESPATPTEDESDGCREGDDKLGFRALKVSTMGSDAILSAAGGIPKHSPLTRRLSKNPRIEINLASPQHQKKTVHEQQQHSENNNEFSDSLRSRVSDLRLSPTTKFKAAPREVRTE